MTPPTSARLRCAGCTVENLAIPPFEASFGSLIRLVFPQSADPRALLRQPEDFERSLQCDSARDGNPLLAVQPRSDRPTRRRWFWRQPAKDWLMDSAKIDDREASRWMAILELQPSDVFENLSGDPRGLLSMGALLARHPQVMLFHTMGMSPLGRDRVLQTAFDHVDDAVGIYCQTHIYTQGRIVLEELDFPFAQTVHVAESSSLAASRAAG